MRSRERIQGVIDAHDLRDTPPLSRRSLLQRSGLGATSLGAAYVAPQIAVVRSPVVLSPSGVGISSVSPLSGGEGTPITITGTGFDPANTCVFVGDVAAAAVDVGASSSTVLQCTLGAIAQPSVGDVYVIQGVSSALPATSLSACGVTSLGGLGMTLDGGAICANANVLFQAGPATPSVFKGTVANADMCVTIGGTWVDGDVAEIDLHLFCAGSFEFKEVVVPLTFTISQGSITGATAACHIANKIDAVAGVSATADGAGKITITKPGGILPSAIVESTISKK